MPMNYKLSSSMSPSNEAQKMKLSQMSYTLAMGSLMFAIICARPNIA